MYPKTKTLLEFNQKKWEMREWNTLLTISAALLYLVTTSGEVRSNSFSSLSSSDMVTSFVNSVWFRILKNTQKKNKTKDQNFIQVGKQKPHQKNETKTTDEAFRSRKLLLTVRKKKWRCEEAYEGGSSG